MQRKKASETPSSLTRSTGFGAFFAPPYPQSESELQAPRPPTNMVRTKLQSARNTNSSKTFINSNSFSKAGNSFTSVVAQLNVSQVRAAEVCANRPKTSLGNVRSSMLKMSAGNEISAIGKQLSGKSLLERLNTRSRNAQSPKSGLRVMTPSLKVMRGETLSREIDKKSVLNGKFETSRNWTRLKEVLKPRQKESQQDKSLQERPSSISQFIKPSEELEPLKAEISFMNTFLLSSTPNVAQNKYYSVLKRRYFYREEAQRLIEEMKGMGAHKKDIPILRLYNMQECVGSGLYGSVFKATQVLTSCPVAIKVYEKLKFSEDTAAKIKTEIRILRELAHHPFVCALLQVVEDENHIYFVMEYESNGDLVKFFKTNFLFDEAELKRFLFQLLKGVEYIHKKGVIHRDLKLDNILLDSNIEPKITDFGISSFLEELSNQPKETGGTPAYLAPEVLIPSGVITEKTDVWSLGVIIYVMAFGEVPFRAENEENQALYKKILDGSFEFPNSISVSEEMKQLISKMLVVDVTQRLSLAEVINDCWFLEPNVNFDTAVQQNLLNERLKREAVLHFLKEAGLDFGEVVSSVRGRQLEYPAACYWTILRSLSS